MSDLFWIIPLIVLGGSAIVLLAVILMGTFEYTNPRDIAFGAWVISIIASIVSIGLWMVLQNSQGMQVAGFLILVLAGLFFASIFFNLYD